MLAWQLLRDVWANGAYANLVWSTKLTRSTLSPEDRAFATQLAYGTLRHHGQLETILTRAGGKSSENFEPEVWWVLLLGSYQLLHLSTPAHAAVNESVELVKHVGKSRASGVVNAVLRRVSTKTLGEWIDALHENLEADEVLALRYAHPPWIVRQLREALAREGAEHELETLLEAHNTPAPVTACILPGLATISGEDERTPYSPLGVYLQGDPLHDHRVRDLAARIQDEGSQLAALVCANATPLRPGEHVVDACSGPGGKSALLASYVLAGGASLSSVEIAPHRAELVKKSLAGFGPQPNLTVYTGDVLDFLAETGKPVDRILLDAPCLGLGALRRRPEARWTKSESDLTALNTVQRRLLSGALDHLAPGGTLTYVTCSPVVLETTDVIAHAMASRDDVTAIDTWPILQAVSRTPLSHAAVGTAVQLWPHRHGTDAMFIQVLQKLPASVEQ